jgi:streptogramin lyase
MKAALIVLAAASALSACTSTPEAPSIATSPSTSSSDEPAGPYAGAEAVIDVAAGPRGVAFADGSVWVASTIGGVITRVDPTSNTVVAEIEAVRPVTLVTIHGQLWASVLNGDPSSDDEIVRIDTATNAVGERVSVPVFHNIAAGPGAIWAVDPAGELHRVEPVSGAVTSPGPVGAMTIGIAANDEALWGIRGDRIAWRLPVDGGQLLEKPLDVPVPGRSRVAVGPGAGASVWVAVPGAVLTLDRADLSVGIRLSLPGMELVNDLWVTETDVWLSANVTDDALGLDGGSVLRLDPATAEVTATYRLGPESSGVVVAAGSVWAVDQADNKLARFPMPVR